MSVQPLATTGSHPVETQRALSLSLCIKSAVLLGLAATVGSAAAEPSPALDRFSISAGAFYAEPKIQLGADTRYGRLDTPNEKQDERTLPRVRADLLLGDSQGLAFDYYRYDKSYNADVSGNTVVDGQPVSGSAALSSDLQLDLAKLAYKWWLGSGNDVFGIGLGAAYYHAKLEGEANGILQGTVGGIPQTITASGSDSVSESAFAPLLELGWRHAFSPDLRMYAEVSGIKKNGGNINGHIYGGALGLEWFPLKNVGLVLDYGVQKIKLHRDSERTADLNIRLTGPSAYVKVRF